MYPLRILLVLAFASLFSSCETDFQLEGEWKDIPVVYAYFSTQDTAHYIRVERAFLEPGGDAREIAQLPDSIYYSAEQAVVTLRVGSDNPITFERVDGEAEGYPRESGPFANVPNILYKLTKGQANLESGDQLELTIDRGGNTDPAIASTRVLSPVELANVPIDNLYRFGDYDRNTRIQWRTNGESAQVFDLQMIIHYQESPDGSPASFEDREVVWVLSDAFERDESISLQTFTFSNESFYQFIASAIEPLPNGVRKFSSIDIQVTAAGQEVADYLRIAGANIGITSSQALPLYTNVDGGLGVVTSRFQTSYEGLMIDNVARDSLYDSSFTRDLNFVP